MRKLTEKMTRKIYIIICCISLIIFIFPLALAIYVKNLNDRVIIQGEVLSEEPDPSAVIKYWSKYKELDSSDFVYLTDEKTNLPLGAWPKNYKKIPTQLSDYKEYNGFVWPVTPTDNTYTFVYEHKGIDIMADIGTPVYSPVDGIIQYSEWGHTVNLGSDETAYSVSIALENPIKYGELNITTVYLTHLSGIRYRCNNTNQKVKKGELLGYTGTASGTDGSIGWAPHLHMSIYDTYYERGLYTTHIQKLFNINTNEQRKVGE